MKYSTETDVRVGATFVYKHSDGNIRVGIARFDDSEHAEVYKSLMEKADEANRSFPEYVEWLEDSSLRSQSEVIESFRSEIKKLKEKNRQLEILRNQERRNLENLLQKYDRHEAYAARIGHAVMKKVLRDFEEAK